MEFDNSLASHTFVKRERSTDLEHETDAPSPKRQADETSAVVCLPVEFPWRTCQGLDDLERLKIKEKAVKEAERNCKMIRTELIATLKKLPQDRDSKSAVIMGRNIIEQWMGAHDNVRQLNNSLHILIGVEGPTGAGKSSFLGCLLGIPELFPSGQESASTAVVGKVSWNYSDNPGQQFRANITFRNKDDVENDLKSLLTEINRYADLEAGNFEEEDDDPVSRIDAKIESKDRIDYELPMVKAVWGLELQDLQDYASQYSEERTYDEIVQSIPQKNKLALQYLEGGKSLISSDTAKSLARKAKPFLDSSFQGGEGRKQWAAWPLVKEVHLYVKADILKSGITLVDLPGCGDATASRSGVAQNFSRCLDVRMVVSPIIRMTDEKQAHSLIQSGFDQAQMRIGGKLDGNGFCVIASKMDDIKVDTYISSCPELCYDDEILDKEDKLEYLGDKSTNLKKKQEILKDNKKKAKTARDKAAKVYDRVMDKHLELAPTNTDEQDRRWSRLQELRADKDETSRVFDQVDKELESHDQQLDRIDKEILYLRHCISHRAIQTRNKRVMTNIRAQFAHSQEDRDGGSASTQPQSETDYVLPILAVSTKAFLELESSKKFKKVIDGFPDFTFTGIPAAEQWIHRATMGKREKHLDEVLDEYQNLMTMMRIYSQTNGQDGNFDFTRSQVEDAVASTHAIFRRELGITLDRASERIKKLDPLEHKAKAMKKFITGAVEIASNWVRKFPGTNKDDKMTWNSYGANITRGGGTYVTKTKPPITYNWMENLTSPVLETISKDWDSKMNKRLPKIKLPMMSAFCRKWTQYLDQLQKDINSKIPSLQISFRSLRPTLDASQRATETKVQKALDRLSQKASGVSFDAVEVLTTEMRTTFEIAKNITGRHSFERRRETIVGKVQQDVEPMCKEMIRCLECGLAQTKAEVPDQLLMIAEEAVRNVEQQMSSLVNNLVENSPDGLEKHAAKSELQKNIRRIVETWESDWAREGNHDPHILDQDLSIPDVVPMPDLSGIDLEDDGTSEGEDEKDEDYVDED